jgi:hypothetical protein
LGAVEMKVGTQEGALQYGAASMGEIATRDDADGRARNVRRRSI